MEKSEISREWREILARGYLDVEGIRFDVTHLRDAEYCFRIEATGTGGDSFRAMQQPLRLLGGDAGEEN